MLYPFAPAVAGQDSATCALPAVAVKLAGGARFTNKVVEPVWVIVPLVAVTVSERA
jgi:hypothetical protein